MPTVTICSLRSARGTPLVPIAALLDTRQILP
jgi:hypothetical protein